MKIKDFAQNIREEYDVKGGIIQNPGKFECEPEWVPYYWELALNGDGEDVSEYDEEGDPVGCFVTRFRVDYEESDVFGLECGATVEVLQDYQGYVIGKVMA